jgi:DNA mismatch repair ATPase MutS
LLQEIVERMNGEGRTPSRQIARLARLADYWESVRRNQFVVPFAFLWMLFVHLAYAIERWRRVNGPLVSRWLAAVGEFEALNSLAGHAYEHPAFPFPEIVDGGPLFKAGQLGHPLISARTRVANDICLDAGHPMLLVSGSNMSGKSTLLRTVGLNAAMALAGGPVCAERLEISPLAIASSMRIVDSLQDGVSAFYAEIRRLRAVCDRADLPPKVLFLLDEILHGTNSHDRRIGAEVVIQCLLDKNAIGLVTTHDLALAEIADRANSLARNVHFEDQLIDDRLEFDYHLRPGVVPKGNGLVLMRLLGFEV